MKIKIVDTEYIVEKLPNGKWALPDAYENGDDTCGCFALDIDGNRVGTETRTQFSGRSNANSNTYFEYKQDNAKMVEVEGRYPSQTFVNSNTAEVLDKQSGVSKGGTPKLNSEINRIGLREDAPAFNSNNSGIDVNKGQGMGNYGDIGGCSKILHKCDFEENEHDLYFYNPKVSKSERNAGCDDMEEHFSAASEFRPNHMEKTLNGENGNPYGRWKPLKNNHPTLKPIKLNERILKLFKTPNEQKIIYPFAGSGSEIIGGIKAGFTNWVGCEINPDYVEIAKARIDYWSNKFDDGLDEIVVEKEIDKSQISLFDLMEG